MPGKDKHLPWDSSVFTHAISDNTDMNSSECEEPTPRQNRGSGYAASSRDNPLTTGQDDNSNNDQEQDPSYRLCPLGRDCGSSKRSSNLKAQTQPTLNTIQNSEIRQLTEQSTIWNNSIQAEPISHETQVEGWMNLAGKGETNEDKGNSSGNSYRNIHPNKILPAQQINQQIGWGLDPGEEVQIKNRNLGHSDYEPHRIHHGEAYRQNQTGLQED